MTKKSFLTPQLLRKQSAWYYLPQKYERHVYVCKQMPHGVVEIKIPAEKLFLELQVIYGKKTNR